MSCEKAAMPAEVVAGTFMEEGGGGCLCCVNTPVVVGCCCCCEVEIIVQPGWVERVRIWRTDEVGASVGVSVTERWRVCLRENGRVVVPS